MLHQNYTLFIGHRYDEVSEQIKADFPGTVQVLTPGEVIDASVQFDRLKVLVDDMNIITEIING